MSLNTVPASYSFELGDAVSPGMYAEVVKDPVTMEGGRKHKSKKRTSKRKSSKKMSKSRRARKSSKSKKSKKSHKRTMKRRR